jgi:hypothetical protein
VTTDFVVEIHLPVLQNFTFLLCPHKGTERLRSGLSHSSHKDIHPLMVLNPLPKSNNIPKASFPDTIN